MRILFVTPYLPSRIRARSYGFVQQLGRRHKVQVLALSGGEREAAGIRAMIEDGIAVTALHEGRGIKIARCLGALGTAQPLQVAFDASARLRAMLGTLIKSGEYDLLHIEFVRALGMLPAPPSQLPLPCVWDAVDCVSHLYQLGATAGATPLLRLWGRYEAERLRAYECEQLTRFRHILVSSSRERAQFLQLAEAREHGGGEKGARAEISVLPHGLDQSYFQCNTGWRAPDTLIFSGKMSFHANVAGATMLLQRIMPLLWRVRPTLRLIIAGSDPPSSLCRLARDARIEVTGYVPDLRPYLARAYIALCPLPYAVGIQNKVLEAMALGTPVIASPSVAAGLQVESGRELLIAETPEQFAAATLRLLDDTALWQQLAARGRHYIEVYHNWDVILTRLEALYARAMQQRTHYGGL
jgi:glycosyltransferase involved in cell wall biosynthesis